MAGPANAVMGDDYGTDIPVSNVDEVQLLEEQKAARYSKSHEYKKLQAHWDAKIAEYQTYLPNGDPVATSNLDLEELGRKWLLANRMIAEINMVKNYYETAQEVTADK